MAIVVGEESAEVIVVGERAGVRGCTVKLPDGLLPLLYSHASL